MDINPNTIFTGALAVLAAVGAGPIIIRVLGNLWPTTKEDKDTRKVEVETESVSVQTAQSVVNMVKDQLGAKILEAETYREQVGDMLKRLADVERREDQLDVIVEAVFVWAKTAYSVLKETHPDFDPPPYHLLEEYKYEKDASARRRRKP